MKFIFTHIYERRCYQRPIFFQSDVTNEVSEDECIRAISTIVEYKNQRKREQISTASGAAYYNETSLYCYSQSLAAQGTFDERHNEDEFTHSMVKKIIDAYHSLQKLTTDDRAVQTTKRTSIDIFK